MGNKTYRVMGNTWSHVLGGQMLVSLTPKGLNIPAQGNALGNDGPLKSALKGRHMGHGD